MASSDKNPMDSAQQLKGVMDGYEYQEDCCVYYDIETDEEWAVLFGLSAIFGFLFYIVTSPFIQFFYTYTRGFRTRSGITFAGWLIFLSAIGLAYVVKKYFYSEYFILDYDDSALYRVRKIFGNPVKSHYHDFEDIARVEVQKGFNKRKDYYFCKIVPEVGKHFRFTDKFWGEFSYNSAKNEQLLLCRAFDMEDPL